MDVFVHTPKASGSTIRTILSRQYGVDKILYFEPSNPLWVQRNVRQPRFEEERFLRDTVAARDVRLITGHYHYGIHRILKKPCRYFSMVRDPVDRALSEYYSAFAAAEHVLRNEITAGTLSADEFMTNPGYPTLNILRNLHFYQAGLLAGGSKGPENSWAEAAVENIRVSFATVGVSERFEESILLVAKSFGWRPPIFVSRNVTKLDRDVQAQRESLSKARERYKEYFKEDYLVYDAVNALLSARIDNEGADFKSALDAFREIQADIAAHTSDEAFSGYGFEKLDELPDFAKRFTDSEGYRKIKDYLRPSGSTAAMGKNYVGHIDAIDNTTIAGWATDLARAEPIHVTVWRSGRRIGTARCDIPRDDVLKNGFPNKLVGFRVNLARGITNLEDTAVCYEDTRVCLPSPTEQCYRL
jgi:hypothetical protein